MKKVVSVSLGSSQRDYTTSAELLGEKISISRIGTDGSFDRARQMFLDLDKEVDVFGLGGAEFGINFGEHYYQLRSVLPLVAGLKTPVVDGTGVRAVVEGSIAKFLSENLYTEIQPKRVLVCVSAGRFDFVRSFIDDGFTVKFGDPGFILGLPVTSNSYWLARTAARFFIPLFVRAPFSWLYPTGKAQHVNRPKFQSWFDWATVIADDFHYIKRHLPLRIDGKIIVTNTTTEADRQMLQSRGASYVVTTTPLFEGRSFGTNLFEAALTAAVGKNRSLETAEIQSAINELGIEPEILQLN